MKLEIYKNWFQFIQLREREYDGSDRGREDVTRAFSSSVNTHTHVLYHGSKMGPIHAVSNVIIINSQVFQLKILLDLIWDNLGFEAASKMDYFSTHLITWTIGRLLLWSESGFNIWPISIKSMILITLLPVNAIPKALWPIALKHTTTNIPH